MATTGGDGAGTANDFTIKVGAEPNTAEFRAVLTSLEQGFQVAGEKIAAQLSAEFEKFAKNAGKHVDSVSPHIRNAAKELSGMGDAGEQAFKGIEATIQQLFRVLDRFGRSVAENVGVLATAREGARRQSVEVTARSQDVARQQIEDTRSVSRAHSVETQQITTQERSAALERIQISKNEGREQAIAAQRAAKIRVLAVQGAIQTIGRLEKGLGVTLAGIARTASTAFSKIFSGRGIAGAVSKQNGELNSELRRTNSIVETNTHQINNSFTEGTNTALNKRESLIRNSFRDQETIIRQSAVRQAAVFEGLRKQTQTGVVGAANRGLNIGAFLGGAAIFTAVRSTFTVGSEFVRGLAVLQSSLDLTADQMKEVRQLAIDLGNDITLPGVSALDAAQAIQILTKQFGSLGEGAVDAAEKAAKGTLQLARAAGVGAEDAAGIIGAAVNVFKIGADQAVAVADNVAGALAKAAGVSFTDFRDAFVQGATVFEQFVGPVESAKDTLLDFNTTLAVLAKNGITGSNAGAGLKQFFLQATKASPKAQETSAALAKKIGETGNIFFDAGGKARKYDDALRILRTSLKGLTDEQRNSTLATLFGSRSITIASALINTSQDDYDNLRKSIQKEGLAAKIAAAQNTGFAGALDALKSVIETAQILLFEKLNPILKTVTLGFAVFFNNILSGKGVWDIVRRGLLGIAAGLGAVLALKGAIELFQLLGTTLGFLLTPMGAFLAAAAAIGAAISILADKSPEFRKALDGIRDTLLDLSKKAVGLAGTGLKNLGDIIVRDVLPFLEAVGRVIGTKVIAAFRFLSVFVTDTVIPALKTMAEFVERNAKKGWDILVRFFEDKVIPIFKRIVEFVDKAILPKLKELAGFVAHELVDAFKVLVDFLTGSVYPAIFGIGLVFGPTGVAIAAAASAIIFFWDKVRPVLQPAIDGFKTLGEALSTAFTLGDLSGVGAGLSAAGSGIARVASTIGGLIVAVLAAAGRAIVAALKEVFSLPHLIAAGKGFLDFVEFVGNTLGKIVSNPKFIAAVAAIGAALVTAAGLVVLRFVEGFAKGINENFPRLVKDLGEALIAVFTAALANPGITVAIVAGIAALIFAISRGKAFFEAGRQAGGGFLGGFKAAFSGARGAPGFLSGLFGGSGSVLAKISSDAQQEARNAVAVQRGQLRAFGSTTVPTTADTFKVRVQNARELARLTKLIPDAQQRGLVLRDTFIQVSKAASTFATEMGRGLTQFGSITQKFALNKALLSPTSNPLGPKNSVFSNITNTLRGPANEAFGGIIEGWKTVGRTLKSGFETTRLKGMYAFDQVKREADIAFGGVLEGWKTAGRTLKSGFETARLKGMFAFDAIKGASSKAFDGIRTGGAKAFEWLKDSKVGVNARAGFSAVTSAFSSGFSTLKSAFINGMDSLRTIARERSTTIGKVIGQGIATGAGIAATGLGGFVVGKSVGESGGSTLLPAILSGLTATALFSELGAAAPVIGVATAALTLFGGALGAADKKAKDLRESIKNLSSTFQGEFDAAIKAGQITLEDLAGLDIKGALNLDGVADSFKSAFVSVLTPAQIKAIKDAGLNLDDINRLFADAGGNADTFRHSLVNAFTLSGAASADFRKRFGNDADEVAQIMADIGSPGGPFKTLQDFFKTATQGRSDDDDVNKKAAASLSKYSRSAIAAAVANRGFLSTVNGVTTGLGGEAAAIATSFGDAKNLEAIIAARPSFGDGVRLHDFSGSFKAVNDLIAESTRQWQADIRAGLSIDEANADLETLKLPPIDPAVIKAWKSNLDTLTSEIADLQDQLDKFPAAWAAAIAAQVGATQPIVTAAQAAVAAASDAPGLTVDPGTVLGKANRDLSTAALSTDFTSALAALIKDNPNLSPADAQAALGPLKDAAIEAINNSVDLSTPEGKAAAQRGAEKVNEIFLATVVSLPVTIDQIHALQEAEDTRKAIQDVLTANPLVTEIQAKIQVGNRKAFSAAQAAGQEVRQGLGSVPVGSSITLTDLGFPSEDEFHGLAAKDGVQITKGLAAGLNDPAAQHQLISRARALAEATLLEFNHVLGIHSPSKVTHEMGIQLTRGLALGIESGADAAAKASAQAAQAAVDAANDVVNKTPINGPRTSFTNDPPETAQESARRDAHNFAAVIVEQIANNNFFHPEGVPDDVMAASINKWFSSLLTPDLIGVLTQGINDGSIRTQGDADVAVQGTKDLLLGGVTDEVKAMPFWPILEKTVTESFDTITADAQDAIDRHNELVMANTERILGHGLPAPTTPMSQTEIVDARNRADQLVRDHQRLRGHGIPIGSDEPRAFGDLGSTNDLGALTAAVKSLQATAAQLNNKPNETHVNIYETKDPRATARATIAELRADRLLQHGIR